MTGVRGSVAKAQRRIGREQSKTRSALLDTTERLMVNESFASVTSRRVAAMSGVQAALVHYYFPTIDDLFVAVYRRRSERLVERIMNALQEDQPLWAIWEFNSDRTATALVTEFLALTNHRTAIRDVVYENAELVRKLQIEGITEVLGRYEAATGVLSPSAIVLLMIGLTRAIVVEESLGLTTGHAETEAMVEQLIEQMEGPRRPKAAKRTPARIQRVRRTPPPGAAPTPDP
jgi:AcrR family transcriptional regulator